MTERTLIAGIGNIFCSDDGFGVEVAHRLMTEALPPGVEVKDYGIRGLHLAYDLAAGFRTAILVDAVARGGPPGTVYVIEPDRTPAGSPQPGGPQSSGPQSSGPAPPAGPAAGGPLLDAHGMQPDVVLQMLDTLGGPGWRDDTDRRLRAGQHRLRHRADPAGQRGDRGGDLGGMAAGRRRACGPAGASGRRAAWLTGGGRSHVPRHSG